MGRTFLVASMPLGKVLSAALALILVVGVRASAAQASSPSIQANPTNKSFEAAPA
jgi:hypothetical protein